MSSPIKAPKIFLCTARKEYGVPSSHSVENLHFPLSSGLAWSQASISRASSLACHCKEKCFGRNYRIWSNTAPTEEGFACKSPGSLKPGGTWTSKQDCTYLCHCLNDTLQRTWRGRLQALEVPLELQNACKKHTLKAWKTLSRGQDSGKEPRYAACLTSVAGIVRHK